VVLSKAEKARSRQSTERSGASTLRKSQRRSQTVFISFLIFIGQQVQVPMDASNCQITNLKLDKDRKTLLERKKRMLKSKQKHREGMSMND